MRASLALALLVLSAPAPAETLGTLFHSAKEREALEKLRQGGTPGQASAVAPSRDPVVTGYVKRSDGRSTVFLDKQPYRVGDGRVHDRLEPRIVDRYEPLPLPPAAAAPPADAAKPAKGAPASNKAPAAPSPGKREE